MRLVDVNVREQGKELHDKVLRIPEETKALKVAPQLRAIIGLKEGICISMIYH